MTSNPFSKAASNRVPLPRNREIRPMTEAPRAISREQSHSTDNMGDQSIDQGTMFTDPAEVQHWVATSATGPAYPVNPSYASLSQVGHSGVVDVSRQCPTFQGSDSLPQDLPLQFPYGQELYNQCFSADAITPDTCPPTLTTEPSFGSDGSSPSDLVYDIPSSADMVYTTSSSSNLYMDELYGGNGAMKNLASLQHDGSIFQTGFSNPTSWSSPSSASLEPSLPSSYARGSLFHGQENSPTSFATEDSSSNVSIQDDGFLPPSVVEIPVQAPYNGGDLQFDITSTMGASNGLAGAPMMDTAFWPPQSPTEIMVPGLPIDMYISRRSSSEHDNSSARRNELYHVGPKEDGLYHCPFEVSDGCKHKPEKLKCNYDKHLDSHLKPYRCKVPACGSVPFSSTACLLRHEREAHGMHGHGDRPYMCSYPDCDRSLQGNGFPRRWNLMDHMKRVHDHQVGPTNGRSSPTPSDIAKASRRRRTSTSSQASGSKVSKGAAKSATTVKQKTLQRQSSY